MARGYLLSSRRRELVSLNSLWKYRNTRHRLSVTTDTLIQSGGIPIRLGLGEAGKGEPVVLEPGRPREARLFDGKTYVMEAALKGDVAVLRAWKVDEEGNCQFRYGDDLVQRLGGHCHETC